MMSTGVPFRLCEKWSKTSTGITSSSSLSFSRVSRSFFHGNVCVCVCVCVCFDVVTVMVVMNESMREEVLREKIRARDTLGGNGASF